MEDRDKKADEIVEETMKEIFEDLNNSEAFQETEDKNEEIYINCSINIDVFFNILPSIKFFYMV